MKNVVRQRVEGSQFEDRSTNRQWLARYLEVCRHIVVEDLKIVKSGLVTFFPPEYSIYDRMIKFYHDCVTDKVIHNNYNKIPNHCFRSKKLLQLHWKRMKLFNCLIGSKTTGSLTNFKIKIYY